MATYLQSGSSWAGRHVFLEEVEHEGKAVLEGAVAFSDVVGAVGVVHELEGLFEGDQLVHEHLGGLEMDIVVA
jgi:hypothetical protein